ncbi:MAG TPA: ribonuclease R [Syntrophorhabdales bacterium]|nr:ribonuclease R [Syntrophorhabdales bacterium]
MKKQRDESVSQDDILQVFKKEKRPLSVEDLRRVLNWHRSQKKQIRKSLQELVRAGKLVRIRENRFGIPDEMNLEIGILWCTRSGNGFVVPEKAGHKDVFVPARYIRNAMHGDKVVVRVEHTGRERREGRIVKVAERKSRNVTGFLRVHKELTFLVPEDERLSHHFLVRSPLTRGQIKDGALAAARITRFPEENGESECRLVKLFPALDNVKAISQFITYKHNLPGRFTKRTDAEAKVIAGVPAEGRLDLRSTTHVTIDGELAKDFDDAVLVDKERNRFILYVSIADVAHYVRQLSSMDDEAYARGTSVYFPGSVIPMLPKELSNGICSLNPREERLTLTARLHYDSSGNLLETSFHKSIIRSARRLTYRKVEDALVKKDARSRGELKELLPELDRMAELATMLKQKREGKGGLDFDLPEPEVVLDMEGSVTDIMRSERLFSQTIIEEFMIAANQAVAAFIQGRKAPSLYRIHEPPEREKLHDFEKLLRTLSVHYRKDSRGRLPLQSILQQVENKDYEFLINRILLRSMKQAKYSAANKGHFGLALDSYTHFTSPIRRYPDLVCHRVLKSIIEGSPPPYPEQELDKMATHLSDRERVAMEAERELEDRVRVLFMKERVGEEYEGVISHITSYGFFVELFDVFVEGIVLLSSLYDDYYAFQEDKFRLVGRRTRKIYRIGDHVSVRITMADVETNRLHFALARD